jgi:hypothetical protein
MWSRPRGVKYFRTGAASIVARNTTIGAAGQFYAISAATNNTVEN